MPESEYVTPLMQQYWEIKKTYPGCLVLFRLGDFYELFDEDARIGADILGITLTRKAQKKGGDVPMAGVPYHALDTYLEKLVQAGFKVALCEQMEPADGKTLVERAVVRIITPGTAIGEYATAAKENRFLAAVTLSTTEFSVAWADVSTGELIGVQRAFSYSELQELISQIAPAECIVPTYLWKQDESLQDLFRHIPNCTVTEYEDWDRFAARCEHILKNHFGITALNGLEIHTLPLLQQTLAAILGYLEYTQRQPVNHMQHFRFLHPNDVVILDPTTVRNLEIFTGFQDHLHLKSGKKQATSLVGCLDNTTTNGGGRLLRQWLKHPLRHQEKLEMRLNTVEYFLKETRVRKNVRSLLQGCADLERILGRLAVQLGTPRDCARLAESIRTAQTVFAELAQTKSPTAIPQWQLALTPELLKLSDHISETLVDDPSNDAHDGTIIRQGVDSELDGWHAQLDQTEEWLLQLEKEERSTTGISTLRIKRNKVFGFFIEVSKAAALKMPESYHRLQTLVNAERYTTPQLKIYESELYSAKEKIVQREFEIFCQLRENILEHTQPLQKLALSLAETDVLSAFAQKAEEAQYCRPTFTAQNTLQILQGRHPTVEQFLPTGSFVPNDTTLNKDTTQMLILTGPNMGGKSVYMRQIALITLLAHIGSYVPAQSVSLSIVDRIFVRSGAADMISAGLSTFMVEMVETASIVRQATEQSLVILDEIGRGTSTYDGMSLAWAVAEFLVTDQHCRPKTIFATHYLELQELAEKYEHVQNIQVAVAEKGSEPIFLHQVIPGGASHSFGIAVAKQAGLPSSIIEAAQTKLQQLETSRDEL